MNGVLFWWHAIILRHQMMPYHTAEKGWEVYCDCRKRFRR